jgi:hypothetical protein
VSIIIIRYRDHMKFYCFFHILLVLWCNFIYGCMFCMLLFNLVKYVFLLLCYVFLLSCMFRSRYCVSLSCSVYCLYVNVYLLLPPGVNPIAVNKYIDIILSKRGY